MLSKKLLSEVLEKLIYDYEIFENHCFINEDERINIYELAFKCKDWALEQGYDVCEKEIDGKFGLLTEEYIYPRRPILDRWIKSDDFPLFNTRLEAIFKACQWILDSQEKHN